MVNSPSERLWTKAADVSSDNTDGRISVAKLGGVRIYAPSDNCLADGLECILRSIRSKVRHQLCIRPKYLFGLCRREAPTNITIFRACLGSEARRGGLTFALCRSLNGIPFRIVVGTSQLDDFRARLADIIGALHSSTYIKVREIQDRFFPDRPKGSWFTAEELLQRLVYLGYLEQSDKWSFRVPESLLDATAEIGWEFNVPDPERLA